MKLSSATTCHKLLSTATLGFNLCHFEVWGEREDRKGWVKSRGIPAKHPIPARPVLPEQDVLGEAALQGSAPEATTVHTAAARALRRRLRKRAAGARDDGRERERMSLAGMEREAESQRRDVPPQPLRKQIGKGKRCHYRRLILIFLFVAKITFPPSLPLRH